eukprot:4470068-Pyramimonas_sp.AAC.1
MELSCMPRRMSSVFSAPCTTRTHAAQRSAGRGGRQLPPKETQGGREADLLPVDVSEQYQCVDILVLVERRGAIATEEVLVHSAIGKVVVAPFILPKTLSTWLIS